MVVIELYPGIGSNGGMTYRLHRFIALLLSCLLGFAPLQTAFAAGMPEASAPVAEMPHDHQAMEDAQASDKACDQCQLGDCCGNTHCMAGHCAVCVANAMAATLVYTDHERDRAYLESFSSCFPNSACYGLFRPPRV